MKFLAALGISLVLNLAIVVPLTVAYLIPNSTMAGNTLAQMAVDSHLIPPPGNQELVAGR